MSEIDTTNNWWKLEDSWNKIRKILPMVCMPLIGIALIFIPLLVSTYFRLYDFWFLILVCIIAALVLLIIGLVYIIILEANQIGNIIKLYKIKETIPDQPEFRKVFAFYLVGVLAPIVGPLFWAKSINKIMNYLNTQISIQKDIEFVENKGKIYSILGIIVWGSFFGSYIYYYVMRFLTATDKIIITQAFLEFLIIFFSSLGGLIIILCIVMVAIQIQIIKRLTNSIHESGLY